MVVAKRIVIETINAAWIAINANLAALHADLDRSRVASLVLEPGGWRVHTFQLVVASIVSVYTSQTTCTVVVVFL